MEAYFGANLDSLVDELLALGKVMGHGSGRAYLPNGLEEGSLASGLAGGHQWREAYGEHHDYGPSWSSRGYADHSE